MQKRSIVAAPKPSTHEIPPENAQDLPPDGDTCADIIARYNLLRYNLFKEKYEKHGNKST